MKRSSRKGFTLLELIVAVVVLGILGALAAPSLMYVKERSTDEILLASARAVVRSAQAAAYMDAAELSNEYIDAAINETTGRHTTYENDGGSISILVGELETYAAIASDGSITLHHSYIRL